MLIFAQRDEARVADLLDKRGKIILATKLRGDGWRPID
jgi:hypothetical protein